MIKISLIKKNNKQIILFFLIFYLLLIFLNINLVFATTDDASIFFQEKEKNKKDDKDNKKKLSDIDKNQKSLPNINPAITNQSPLSFNSNINNILDAILGGNNLSRFFNNNINFSSDFLKNIIEIEQEELTKSKGLKIIGYAGNKYIVEADNGINVYKVNNFEIVPNSSCIIIEKEFVCSNAKKTEIKLLLSKSIETIVKTLKIENMENINEDYFKSFNLIKIDQVKKIITSLENKKNNYEIIFNKLTLDIKENLLLKEQQNNYSNYSYLNLADDKNDKNNKKDNKDDKKNNKKIDFIKSQYNIDKNKDYQKKTNKNLFNSKNCNLEIIMEKELDKLLVQAIKIVPVIKNNKKTTKNKDKDYNYDYDNNVCNDLKFGLDNLSGKIIFSGNNYLYSFFNIDVNNLNNMENILEKYSFNINELNHLVNNYYKIIKSDNKEKEYYDYIFWMIK